jgi:hypothetical protein
MPKKRFSADQIVVVLRQIEVLMSQGKTPVVACLLKRLVADLSLEKQVLKDVASGSL